MEKYLDDFFKTLEIYEDIYNEKNYKEDIQNKIKAFIKTPDIITAEAVYKSFFIAYWIGIQDEKNPFIELILSMRKYEQASGMILEKQRDHLIHSVNVFLLGICIYSTNSKMKETFSDKILKSGYKDYYQTKDEEFFYRWGISSLFHDIAYPLEVSLKQVKKYAEILNGYTQDETKLNLAIKFENTEALTNLGILSSDEKYIEEFNKKYPNINDIIFKTSIDLLTKNISNNLEIDFEELKEEMLKKQKVMESGQYIDHGFYSALICLKWYFHLYKKTNWNPSYFYYCITDIATSILMHNFYSKGLMNEPFGLGKLNFKDLPISYLLILCDELQEWNRVRFYDGDISIENIELEISNNTIDIEYIVKGDVIGAKEKKQKIIDTLEINDLIELNIKEKNI